MSLEDEDPAPDLDEMKEEILETTHEIAQQLVEDLIFYRPKTGSLLWVMWGLLKQTRQADGLDWRLVRNPFGWFHIVRGEDLETLTQNGYSEVEIKSKEKP